MSARHSYELPSQDNQHRIAVNQHILPAESIKRFYSGAKQAVDLLDVLRHKRRAAASDDKIFCAKRVWDQHSEGGFMRMLETAFQNTARSVIAEPDRPLSKKDNATAIALYALWRARYALQSTPIAQDLCQELFIQNRSLSQLEQEEREIEGLIYYGPNGFSDRQIKGSDIKDYLMHIRRRLRGIVWSPLMALDGEFVVPACTRLILLPLSPVLFLVGSEFPRKIGWSEVRDFNLNVLQEVKEYYFSRNLLKFPGVSEIMHGHLNND